MDRQSGVRELLAAFAGQYNTEAKRYHGVSDSILFRSLPDSLAVEDRHEPYVMALREGLLRHSDRDWETIILTLEGWELVPGGMPGKEKDQPFLAAVIKLWSDPNVKRYRGRLLGSTVYRELNWPFDGAEAGNIARRLAARGLVDQIEMEGDVRVRPTECALRTGAG